RLHRLYRASSPRGHRAKRNKKLDEKLSKAASPEGIHHSVIVLRFSMAEVRISADNNELYDRLIQGVTGIETPDRLVAAKLCTLALPLLWWSRRSKSFKAGV